MECLVLGIRVGLEYDNQVRFLLAGPRREGIDHGVSGRIDELHYDIQPVLSHDLSARDSGYLRRGVSFLSRVWREDGLDKLTMTA